MNITKPTQAFALRDKLAGILTSGLQGYSASDSSAADAETLLVLGIIDVDALQRHGEPTPEPTVAHGEVLTQTDLDELPQFSLIELDDGTRCWKRDMDELPWAMGNVRGGFSGNDDLAEQHPRLVA